MLVLSRKCGEKIVVPQCEITVTVLQIGRRSVKVGISAPRGVQVHREEVWLRPDNQATSGALSGAAQHPAGAPR